MRTVNILLPAALLMTACGSLHETAQVRDDVYDIPDRTVVASVEPASAAPANDQQDDYYDPGTARDQERRDYYAMTYNDPHYYNYGRFGFGTSIGGWGPGFGSSFGYGMGAGMGYGMGLSYGWPYSSTMFNSPTGWYDPYWQNSYMSGYGAWGYPYGTYNPYGYNPFGMNGYYDPYGYGYGYGSGYYMGPCGSYYGGYVPYSSSPTVVAHRPGMGGSGITSNGNGVTNQPRMMRSPAYNLLEPAHPVRTPRTNRDGNWSTRPANPAPAPSRNTDYARPARRERGNDSAPVFRMDNGSRGGGSWGGGGGGGGSTPTVSPRPRR